MAKKKKSLLPGLEIMIIIVFFISFMLFAIPRCNKKKMEYASTDAANTPTATAEENLSTSTDVAPDSILVPATTAAVTAPNAATPVATTPVPQASPTLPPTVTNTATRLYVTIDGLNIRSGPSLDSSILNKLVLFEEVHFLNEITPFTEQISLGTSVADEPWVKVKTKRGGEGWVYGAGVYYYKRKYPGMD